MKNKILFSVIIILVAAVGIYFLDQKKPASPGEENNQQTEEPQKIVTEEFSMDVVRGWRQVEPPAEFSAMAANQGEVIEDPKAQEINFKSYFALSHRDLQEQSSEEFFQEIKEGLQQSIPGIVFTLEQNEVINENPAQILEAEFNQQEVDFKVLIAVIEGDADDVWTMSFNTLKSSWDKYRDLFYESAQSFVVKK